ncbi:hypothetical protein BX600DRAFT_429648 [Xylariales sp. PMI_506]|nr:hypothetical protein BX600DRAFT_429648 [Xylariales sp. PMI_506]
MHYRPDALLPLVGPIWQVELSEAFSQLRQIIMEPHTSLKTKLGKLALTDDHLHHILSSDLSLQLHIASPSPIARTAIIIMSSYADVAASGPKQSPEEAAAPPVPEVVNTDASASTSSLVDVDTPSVRTVPSDFNDQEVQTETQAARLEREAEAARAEADLAKKKAGAKVRKADNFLTKFFGDLSDGASSALVISNLVGVVGLSSFLGYKAWDLHERGRLTWNSIGLGLGVLGFVGVVEGFLGGYIYKGKKKNN